MLLENLDHENSIFITLTYDDETLTDLNKRDLQLFFKRLRKRIHPKKIRYFACGEYGEKKGRPHYHAIIFGLDTSYYNDIFYSWNGSRIDVQDANLKAMRYVAGYVLKKLSNDKTGEFILTSRRPGLGANAINRLLHLSDKTGTDVVEFIQIDDKKFMLPPYIRNKIRELKFSEEYIAELKEIIQEEQFKRNLEISCEVELGDPDKAIWNFKKNVVEYHKPSNRNFEELQKVYRKRGKL